MALVAIILVTAITAPLTTPGGAFAYTSQATSQANACGTGEMPINIGCQDPDSQIQGDENDIALTAHQKFPEAELLQGIPPPQQTPPPSAGNVCTGIWEVELLVSLATYLPDGTNLCMSEGTLGIQDAEVVLKLNVEIETSVHGECTDPYVPASVLDSGNPPVQEGDTVCVRLQS